MRRDQVRRLGLKPCAFARPRLFVAVLAMVPWLGCQGLAPTVASPGPSSQPAPTPVTQPLGGEGNMLEMLDQKNKEIQEARIRIRELEGELAALTSEHAKLKIDFDDLSITAQDRGEKLAKGQQKVVELERELMSERDERARMTDLFLAARIEKLRLERELLTLRLDSQDQ